MEAKEQDYIQDYKNFGPVKLGILTSHYWRTDPKRFGFVLARYKFVAKMLSGYKSVMEVGCGDGFGAKIVLREVETIHAVDNNAMFIEDCLRDKSHSRLTFEIVDLTKKPVLPKRDAVYAIDVLEHVKKRDIDKFMKNIIESIKSTGVCIIGTPSLESQAYASKLSKEAHVNCKSGLELKALMQKYFKNVFIFGMNDEVLHTGFYPMCHYLFALSVNPKSISDN